MNTNNTTPTYWLTLPGTLIEWLKQLAIATLYVLFGQVIHENFTGDHIINVVWSSSGLALAALLIGGKRYLWGLGMGSLLLNALANDSLWTVIGLTLATIMEALCAVWLLTRNNRSGLFLRILPDYIRLIALGGAVACSIGAIIGASALLLAGIIGPADYVSSALHWWMRDTLSVVLVTPFILAWWQTKSEQLTFKQLLEGLLLITITFIAGQIAFLDWFREIFTAHPKAIMMFFPITWIAIRIGICFTTFALNMVAIQSFLSAYLKVGYFANEIESASLQNYWFYMLVLSVVGMALAAYVNELKQKERDLRNSETHLRLSQIGGGIGTWEADLVNNTQIWSENCISLLGFPALSKPAWENFLEVIYPGDRQRVIDATQSHIDYGIKYDVEYRVIVTDENIRWMRSAGQAERNANGKPIMMRGIVQEVTERKQMEESLRESETLFKESQSIARLGSYVLNISTGLWTSSDMLYQVFGIDPAYECTVDGWLALIHPDDRTMMNHYFKNEVFSQNNTFNKEYRIIRHNDQAERWVHGLGRTEFDAQGYPLKIHGTIQDITERKKVEERLRQSEEKLRAYLDNITDTIWLIGSNLETAYVSPNVTRLLGVLPEELIGRPSALVIHPDDRSIVTHAQAYVQEHAGEPHTIQYRVIHKDGRWIDVESTGINMLCNPAINGVLVSMRDITERMQAERELRIAAIAFESQEGMIVTAADGVILRVNRSFANVTGYSAEEVIGKNPRILQSGQHNADFYADMWERLTNTGAWDGEIWNRRKNGEIYPEYLTITAVKNPDGIVVNYVATFSDITLDKLAAVEIERLAFYDHLTGLPNRRLLQDRLKPALASSYRSGRKGALLFIDMDNFKALNDTLGHDMGDLLLQQVAKRLTSCIREGDTVARLGGDEFVVMLEDLSEQTIEAAAQTEAIGNKILTLLNQSYRLATHDYLSTPSIGAILFNGREQSIDELLKQADIAMYQAKASGRNALRFFDPEMQAGITARVALEADLRIALAEHHFTLYYQPQVYHNHLIIGAETLIRWQHPLHGLVPPADFIPLAEETGLILPIGQWVLEMACTQLEIWAGSAYTGHLQLAVNISARQFRQTDFVEQVSQALNRNAVKPDRLKLELTESLVLNDIDDTILKMEALRKMGVRFSMDDFGTGYSSLSSLKKLPIDQLKIDQSFVHEIAIDPDDTIIVQTIIAMTKNLGMDVIAEGVETELQRAFLEQHGCLIYQGYLFSEPLPIERFEALLKQN